MTGLVAATVILVVSSGLPLALWVDAKLSRRPSSSAEAGR